MAESYQLSQTFGMTKLLNSNLHIINFLQFNKFSWDVTFYMYLKNIFPNEIRTCQLSGLFLKWGKVAGITDNYHW